MTWRQRTALRARFCVPCQAERVFRGLRCTTCKKREPRASKYGNVPKVCGRGRWHHSGGEAGRCDELHWLQERGIVRDLVAHPQPRFDLEHNGVLITTYRADFTWTDANTGEHVTEDWKGQPNETYPIKKALMKALLGIDILETGPAAERLARRRIS